MRLSICIPTYNRAACLVDLLGSILSQQDYTCELEVVISDNASVDNTEEVVGSYESSFRYLTFFRADINHGPDRNFLKVVELATGDYCWLMGSDDVLEPGSIARIEQVIRAHPDVTSMSVRNAGYSADLKERVFLPEPSNGRFRGDQMLHSAEEVFAAMGDYIGFISSNVVKRSVWNEAVNAEDVSPYFNVYIHVYVIGRMLQRSPSWYYIFDSCVGWRSGNDSFLSEGAYRRMELDVKAFDQIGSGLFGDRSRMARRINERMFYHVRGHIIGAKWKKVSADFLRNFRALTVQTYGRSPKFWFQVYPLFFIPSQAFFVARSMYRATLKPLRLRRSNDSTRSV